jgi:hypothetical protein
MNLMFFTLRSGLGPVLLRHDPRINGSLFLLLPSIFILLSHYICFPDIAFPWRIKGVISLTSDISSGLVSSSSFPLDPVLLDA